MLWTEAGAMPVHLPRRKKARAPCCLLSHLPVPACARLHARSRAPLLPTLPAFSWKPACRHFYLRTAVAGCVLFYRHCSGYCVPYSVCTPAW